MGTRLAVLAERLGRPPDGDGACRDGRRRGIELNPFEGQTLKGIFVGVNPGGVEIKTFNPGSKVFVPDRNTTGTPTNGNSHDRVNTTGTHQRGNPNSTGNSHDRELLLSHGSSRFCGR